MELSVVAKNTGKVTVVLLKITYILMASFLVLLALTMTHKNWDDGGGLIPTGIAVFISFPLGFAAEILYFLPYRLGFRPDFLYADLEIRNMLLALHTLLLVGLGYYQWFCLVPHPVRETRLLVAWKDIGKRKARPLVFYLTVTLASVWLILGGVHAVDEDRRAACQELESLRRNYACSGHGFFWAIREGKADHVEFFLKAGINPNKRRDHFGTALMEAGRHGKSDVAEILLRFGGKVNLRDNANGTALHNAASFGSPDIVGMLVRQGANVNARTKAGGEGYNGWTPLHDALSMVNVNYLLSEHRDFKNKDWKEWRRLKKHHPYAKKVRAEEIVARTEIVRILLEAGADPAVADKDGRTPLHNARQEQRLYGDFGEIVSLLDAGRSTHKNNRR